MDSYNNNNNNNSGFGSSGRNNGTLRSQRVTCVLEANS